MTFDSIRVIDKNITSSDFIRETQQYTSKENQTGKEEHLNALTQNDSTKGFSNKFSGYVLYLSFESGSCFSSCRWEWIFNSVDFFAWGNERFGRERFHLKILHDSLITCYRSSRICESLARLFEFWRSVFISRNWN